MIEYQELAIPATISLPDAQVDIELCVRGALLCDTFAKSFGYYKTKDGLQDGVKWSSYDDIHLDIREGLGLSPDCEIDPNNLTPDQENELAEFVRERLLLLKNLDLDIKIVYSAPSHYASVTLSGEGVKGLTMAKVIKAITGK